MNFRSIADLAATVAVWQDRLPRDFTLICGIPRSGLLVANLVALQWNLPLTEVSNLLAGRLLGGGRRLGLDSAALESFLDKPQRILLVEDSVAGGAGMRQARADLRSLARKHEFKYAAVYAAPEGLAEVDFAAEIVPMPRVFEWNLFHHPMLQRACVDIDGVLCRDPSDAENDDGATYRKFLRTASLRHRPSEKIGWLVTSRLEKYRAETEAWLREQGVNYGELCMLDLPDMKTRRETGAGALWKAQEYLRTNANIFIESDTGQAGRIAELSGKPVIATDTMQLLSPEHDQARACRRNSQTHRLIGVSPSQWRGRVRRVWRRWREQACNLLPSL